MWLEGEAWELTVPPQGEERLILHQAGLEPLTSVQEFYSLWDRKES